MNWPNRFFNKRICSHVQHSKPLIDGFCVACFKWKSNKLTLHWQEWLPWKCRFRTTRTNHCLATERTSSLWSQKPFFYVWRHTHLVQFSYTVHSALQQGGREGGGFSAPVVLATTQRQMPCRNYVLDIFISQAKINWGHFWRISKDNQSVSLRYRRVTGTVVPFMYQVSSFSIIRDNYWQHMMTLHVKMGKIVKSSLTGVCRCFPTA